MVELKDVPEITTEHQEKLSRLGYHSVEQFISAAEVASHEFSQYLGVDVNRIITPTLRNRASNLSLSARSQLDALPCSLGAATRSVSTPAVPVGAAIASLAPAAVPTVNLAPGNGAWPVRDQGERGTCVAHAAVSCLEHYFEKHTGASRDMSEQFLYWNCKRNDGIPNTEGTWVETAFGLLKRDGCAEEADWPYAPTPIHGNESHDPPPGGAGPMLGRALTFRVSSCAALPPTSVQDIKNTLAAGGCVAFSIPVFNSWYRSPQSRLTGEITLPLPNEVTVGGHAMCLVGYEDTPNRPEIGGGRFIVRNSWGTSWGKQCSFGSGYGTIPYLYMSRHAMEAYSIA